MPWKSNRQMAHLSGTSTLPDSAVAHSARGALAVAGSNNAVVGGSGAFVGMRGQLGGGQGTSIRIASIAEDPTSRRTNGGGRLTVVVTLIPMSRPEIVATAGGPAIGEARKGRRGSDRESDWPRPHPPWRRPWQAISKRRAPGRQFTGRNDGEWELGRCNQQSRVAWNAGYLPGGFPGTRRDCDWDGGNSIDRRLDRGTVGEYSHSVAPQSRRHYRGDLSLAVSSDTRW